MRYSTQRLHVDLPSRRLLAIKTARHKMVPAVFLQNPTLAHLNSRLCGHPGIGILNPGILWPVFRLLIPVSIHPVKLDQPVPIPLSGVNLTGPHISGFFIPGNDCLRAGAARGGSDPDNLPHGVFANPDTHIFSGAENFRRQLNQATDFDAFGFRSFRPPGGNKFQSAHSPAPCIAQAFHRIE